jgi:hypothetical protein
MAEGKSGLEPGPTGGSPIGFVDREFVVEDPYVGAYARPRDWVIHEECR